MIEVISTIINVISPIQINVNDYYLIVKYECNSSTLKKSNNARSRLYLGVTEKIFAICKIFLK